EAHFDENSSGTETLIFNYNPGDGEESNHLAFKTTTDEAIIDLNGGEMYSSGGNYLKYGIVNTNSPLLPAPGGGSSLDDNKSLKIDGVAPVYFSLEEPDDLVSPKAQGGTASVRPPETGVLWGEGNDIYWNSTHTQLSVLVTLPLKDGERDTSLADDGLLGSIQLRISNDVVPDTVDLGPPVEIAALVDGGPPISQTIPILKNILDLVNGFEDGSSVWIDAIITDLAGNNSQLPPESFDRDDIIIDYVLPDTTGNGSNLTVYPAAFDPVPDPPDPHDIDGYWNSHNNFVIYTIPVQPDDIDETMNNGRVDLLAKINTETSW
ncbi:uncharacterized protein METZ01_LOCUS350794, partial [marine metagenome]